MPILDQSLLKGNGIKALPKMGHDFYLLGLESHPLSSDQGISTSSLSPKSRFFGQRRCGRGVGMPVGQLGAVRQFMPSGKQMLGWSEVYRGRRGVMIVKNK